MGDHDLATKSAPKGDPKPIKSKPAPAPKQAPVQADSGPSCDIYGAGDMCEMARLEVSATTLDFGQVAVGKSKLLNVVVTNEATTEIEIESMKVRQEGLGDFSVAGQNPILQPKERANVAVHYSPTTNGKHVGSLHMLATHVMADEVALRGQGVERPDQRDARAARQDEASTEANASGTKSFHGQRVKLESKINAWSERAKKLATGTALWASQNWTKFYAETGGDFSVAWTEGHLNNVLGDALSMAAGTLVKHPVAEFVVSTLSSLIWDATFTHKGNKENEKTVHDKVKQTNEQSANKQLKFAFEADTTLAHINMLRSNARHRAWSVTTAEELADVQEWLDRQRVPDPPKPTNDSLKRALLKDWVLERAGDASSAGHNTNSASYKEARKSIFKLQGDAKLARADLFIYQARHEWATNLGLGKVPEAELELRQRIATYEKQGLDGGVKSKDIPQFLVNMLDPWFHFPVPQPELTSHILRINQKPGILLRPEDLRKSPLGCHLKLAVDGQSVIVKYFHYYHYGGYAGSRTPG